MYIVFRNGTKKAIRIIIDILAVCVALMLGIVGYGFYAFGYIWQSLHWTVIPCCILGAWLCWGAAGWIMNRLGKNMDNAGE